MSKRTFTPDELEEMGLPHETGMPDSPHVATEYNVFDTRWADAHYLVFRHEGKLWRVTYYTGKTENQEGIGPWGYGFVPDHVEADEVEAVEVTVTEYRPVGES